MKKLHIILYVLAAGLLVISCGKSRKPEVKESAKAAADGLFGSVGEEMIYLMDDLTLFNEEYEKQGEKLRERLNEGDRKKPDSEYQEIINEGMALDKKMEEKKEEIYKKFSKYVEDMKGEKLPTEMAEGAPMKLLNPLIIVGSGRYGDVIQMEAQVELTADLPSVRGWDRGHSLYALFVDGKGNELYKGTISTDKIHNNKISLQAGYSETVRLTINMTSKSLFDILSAKRIVLAWI